MMASPPMYLIDTNVISEARKGRRANAGVQAFFREASEQGSALYLSVITLGECGAGWISSGIEETTSSPGCLMTGSR